MHELVGSDHSLTHVVVGSCQGETRTSGCVPRRATDAYVGISPAEEGWTVANDNETYLVAAPTCNVLQNAGLLHLANVYHGVGSYPLLLCSALHIL
jgi:hypothetical protein